MNNEHSPAELTLSQAERKLMDKTPDADRESRLAALQNTYNLANPLTSDKPERELELERALLSVEIAGLLLDLDRKEAAWDFCRAAIEVLVFNEQFEDAALACQYTYLADQFDALPAIGQAAWLSVTYPVDPHLTANILDHIVDETPDDSDGAAVAAATAHYVVDMRGTGPAHAELRLFTGGMLARVARRHSNVETQEAFEAWVTRLELDDPAQFLGRLRNVIDVMVQSDWWFDREQLQDKLPGGKD